MSSHFITRSVAPLPFDANGYRVTFCAAASREAAEFRRGQELHRGFPCEVIECDERTWREALAGALNTTKAAPGL